MTHTSHQAVIQLSADDYLKAQWLHHRYSVQSLLRISIILALLAVALYALLDTPLPLFIAAAYLAFCLLFNLVYLKWKSNRAYRQQKSLQTPIHIEWNEQNILFSQENGRNDMKWSDFLKYKANKDIILLYYSDALFSMVPTRTFETTEQRDDFLARCALIGKRSVKL